MEIKVTKNYDEMSTVAARTIAREIKANPNLRICFATGGTPIETYQKLIIKYKEGDIDFSNVTTFNLDEYVGIPIESKCSYHYYMHHHLFDHINVKPENINFPNGNGDLIQNAKDYEAKIADGGIDFLILGIGTNAHIAFNEPGSQPTEATREVKLTQSTINSNKIYFDSEADVPKTAISMGIGTILKAKKIILLASGESKAQAIHDAFWGEVTDKVPASFLQNHPDVTFIIDKDAAKLV
ncbi:glucosamine-6-phosphate deaminase [Mycoplasma buteonis]|uniref:glucosamine-6-phosphate deaminase n=1 Tax=Mycoplasma buteonis TaxID=171280 RepID=UPI000568CFB4|nr:glucosamine-6-phosphate deaminase [Mycoplasma buteonis]